MANEYFNQIRKLNQMLTVSVAINIVLLILVFYWIMKETSPQAYCNHKPAEKNEQQLSLASDKNNADELRYFRTLPFEQLIVKLTDTQLVESGYTQRDLALAALTTFHQFDLLRALGSLKLPEQQRKIIIGKNRKGEPVEVTIFPELSEECYQTIIHFTQIERWPFTSQGLYKQLRRQKEQIDPTLADAFYMTPEFQAVETLFSRTEANVNRKDLLTLLLQGNWDMLSTFTAQQRQIQDLSPAKRQRFLIDYITHRSPAAVYMLLNTDGAFAAKKLDDKLILSMLEKLTSKTPEAERFSLILLISPRSDAVWQKAAARLYEFAGESMPENNTHHAAIVRFLPQVGLPMKQTSNPKQKTIAANTMKKTTLLQPAKPALRKKTYVVQEGDSLWKIARRFKVDIDVLKHNNKLESDFLRPGITLTIP